MVFEDMIKVGDYYYFALRELNAIFRLNAESNEVETIYTGSAETLCNYRMYGRVFEHNNKLIFPPLNAKSILVYDLMTKKVEFIEIKSISGCKGDYFLSGIIVEGNLYLVGAQYPAIVKFNLSTHEITYYEEPYVEIKAFHPQDADCYFRADIALVDNKIYAASCLCNRILEFNLADNSYKWYEVGDKNDQYAGIAWDGEKFWLSSRHEAKVMTWQPSSQFFDVTEVPVKEDELYDGVCTFLGIVYDGKNVILPGMGIKKTAIIDANYVPSSERLKVLDKKYTFYVLRDDCIFSQDDNEELLIYRKENLITSDRTISLQTIKKLIMQTMADKGVIATEGFCGIKLDDYLNTF